MKLAALTAGVKQTLQKKMNIKQSLSIMNIPKQKFLDKGDLVILLDNKNEVLSIEWLRDGHYHVEIKGDFDTAIISDILKNHDTRLFLTESFNPLMDTDYVIDYKSLSATTKNKVKAFIQSGEKLYEDRFSKFSKGLNKQVWLKSIKVQNGSFTEWCKERGNEKVTNKCIEEAYRIADASHDYLLKRRAGMAKCFNKISERRLNGQ